MKAISAAIVAHAGILGIVASAFIRNNTQPFVFILCAAVGITGLAGWISAFRQDQQNQ